MTADWLEDCIKPYEFVSLPSAISDARFSIFQFLSNQSKIIVVRTYNSDFLDKRLWQVQSFEVWRHLELPVDPASMDAFIVDDPTSIDIHAVVANENPDRRFVRIYRSRISDLEGCIYIDTLANE
jgi:hypothetical protein